MPYPIYRKYRGIDVWFKITAEDHFIEIKKMGNKWLISEVRAAQFLEKILIQDMINLHEMRWEIADARTVEELIKATP